MFESQLCDFSFWWVFPLLMIGMCYFIMRGRRGSMMCGFGSHGTDGDIIKTANSPMDILHKRYALGEIDKEEYEEKKRTLNPLN